MAWRSTFSTKSALSTMTGRTIRNDYHYIFEPKNSLHYYRHFCLTHGESLCACAVGAQQALTD